MDLKVLVLHEHPEYLQATCELINSEWKRSETARMRSLMTFGEKLPQCLVLVGSMDVGVVGHCKLSPVPSIKNACFIESMVIAKELRGKGLGSQLMQEAERYCRMTLGLKSVYLSTIDQQRFYERLGYVVCAPISIYGAATTETRDTELKSALVESGAKLAPLPPPLPPGSSIIHNKKIYMNKKL